MKKTAFHSFRVGSNDTVTADSKVCDVAEHQASWGTGVATLKILSACEEDFKMEEVNTKSPVVKMA